MSDWERYRFEEKIKSILGSVREYKPEHHLGRPFLTPYQIAIAFAREYPAEFTKMGLPVGGVGAGQPRSLAQYIAKQLSAGIKSGRIDGIEGGFLSDQDLHDVTFLHGETVIQSSLTGGRYPLSLFRSAS